MTDAIEDLLQPGKSEPTDTLEAAIGAYGDKLTPVSALARGDNLGRGAWAGDRPPTPLVATKPVGPGPPHLVLRACEASSAMAHQSATTTAAPQRNPGG